MRASGLGVLLVLALAFVLGCGVPYVITGQTGQAPPRNVTLQLAPLTFADSANRDDGTVREDPGTWAGHTTAWSEKYQLRVLERAKDKGIHIQPGVQPGAPLVLRANVVTIDKNSSTYMGRDHIVADVSITDASNAVVWSARFEAASRGSGPTGYTFGGRIGWAAETLGSGVVDVLAGEPANGSVVTSK